MFFGNRTHGFFRIGRIGRIGSWLSAFTLLAIGLTNASMIPQTAPELTANSSHIVRGEVLNISSHWDENETYIFTLITVQPAETFKAMTELSETITLWIPGGQVGDMKLWVEHTPKFEVGQDVILFLDDHGETFDVTSWTQGKYTVVSDVVLETNEPVIFFIDRITDAIDAEQPKEK